MPAVRVLMLSWELPPSAAGGVAAHVDGLTRALCDAGHDVAVVTRRVPGSQPDSRVDGVRILRADTDLPWLPDSPVAHAASANHAFVSVSEALDGVPDEALEAVEADLARGLERWFGATTAVSRLDSGRPSVAL